MNTNIFRYKNVDEYKYKYIWVDQKWANMNKNMIIQADTCKYKYKQEYYHSQKLNKNIYVYWY